MMKMIGLCVLFVTLCFSAAENMCITCHEGIEDIRDKNSGMMQAILHKAEEAGVKGNDCVICHGGNPEAKEKEEAHQGTHAYFQSHKGPKAFYPYPASPWINENTCGMCHPNQVAAQENNLMATEQGKIHGTLWGFGAKEGYKHTYTNFGGKAPDPHKRLGTETYKKYMEELSALEPQGFPMETKELPAAPTVEEVEKDPTLSVYTYLRQECLRCHTGGKGRERRGDYRGIGCASCHVPYSNAGLYEGKDKSISKIDDGHMLVHAIQSSRDVKVNVHDINYSGIPVETCTTCHNRGKRIGVSYQGLMETEYQATFDDKGNGQPQLHTKRYLHLTEDIHYAKGMLCQDCHTSNDMHGDGFFRGANLGAVEIECQDCHGTTTAFPWELPLGYSDEFDTKLKTGKARGTTKTLAEYLKQGSIPTDTGDGFLLSARGNLLTKAVRKGEKVMMHLSSGKDIELKPLKLLKKENKISQEGLVAMDQIQAHTVSKASRTCESCHSSLKAMGRGINGGKYFSDQSKTTIVDLMRADKTLLPTQVEEQIPAIPNLKYDFSVMIDENGTQVQTVGNHWKLSQALDNETRAKLDRSGACLSCHKEMPNEDLAVSLMVHTAKFAGVIVDNDMHKSIVNKSILLSAWVQVLSGLFLGGGVVYWIMKRKKKKRNKRF